MKKQYIIPEIQVVKIQTVSMIATSGPDGGGSTGDPNDLLSRGFDFGDDEDEE
jgi:hypothetical protein